MQHWTNCLVQSVHGHECESAHGDDSYVPWEEKKGRLSTSNTIIDDNSDHESKHCRLQEDSMVFIPNNNSVIFITGSQFLFESPPF